MVERMVAKKCGVGDLIGGEYIVKEGTAPSFVRTRRGDVSRANLIAAVVGRPAPTTVIVDDGSGTILARAFDRPDLFANVQVGDILLLVGRPRRYDGQSFLAAEIARRLGTPTWLALRRAELEAEGVPASMTARSETALRTAPAEKKKMVGKEEEREGVPPSQEAILAVIRRLDGGEGAAIEAVVEAAGKKEAMSVLTALMAEGEIFEIRPGRVKVLE